MTYVGPGKWGIAEYAPLKRDDETKKRHGGRLFRRMRGTRETHILFYFKP